MKLRYLTALVLTVSMVIAPWYNVFANTQTSSVSNHSRGVIISDRPLEVIDGTDYSLVDRNFLANTVTYGGVIPLTDELHTQLVKINELEDLINARRRIQNQIPQSNAQWYNLANFTYLGQELKTSCVPASVRMALHYYGVLMFESDIRSQMAWDPLYGAPIQSADRLLRTMLANAYTLRAGGSQLTITTHIEQAITTKYHAPIFTLNANSDYGFKFDDAENHAIVVIGIRSDHGSIFVADPYAGFAGKNNLRTYEVVSGDFYQGYTKMSGSGYVH